MTCPNSISFLKSGCFLKKAYVLISNFDIMLGLFNREWGQYGVNKITNTHYDVFGYDEDGYDKRGFDKNGIHFKTRTTKGETTKLEEYFPDVVTLDGVNPFDDRGFDFYGKHRITGTKYDEYGFRKDGIHIDAENRKWSDYL